VLGYRVMASASVNQISDWIEVIRRG